jgi:muconolactone delta-isomerase
MNKYMVEMTLPEVLSKEFLALIPAQRAMVDRLTFAGVIVSYALAMDRSRLWASIAAGSEAEAMQILAGLPLTPYLGVQIHPLAFYQGGVSLIPNLQLN